MAITDLEKNKVCLKVRGVAILLVKVTWRATGSATRMRFRAAQSLHAQAWMRLGTAGE